MLAARVVEICEDDVWSGMGWSWEDLIDYWPEVLEKSVIYPVQPRLWLLSIVCNITRR